MNILSLRCALIGAVFASRVLASTCATTSLLNYISLGAGGCTINGEIVDNFNFAVVATSLGSPLTAGAITVTPTFTSNSYQLFFSASGGTPATGFTVSGIDFARYEIDFTWDPVVVGSEDDMSANTPVFPGTATVTTKLCAGSIFGVVCPPATNTLLVFNDGHPLDSILRAVTTFPPVTVVGTQSLIDLEANGASSTITGFSNSVFSPEPGTLVIVGAGFLALLWRRLGSRRQPTV